MKIKIENNKTRKIYNNRKKGSGPIDYLIGKKEPNKINYPNVSLKYNSKNILCEICKNNSFYKIDASVDRSKTATIFLGSDLGDVVSHPLKMYVCIKCLYCKFVYTSTYWNTLQDKIIETIIDRHQ